MKNGRRFYEQAQLRIDREKKTLLIFLYFLGIQTRYPYFDPMPATKSTIPEILDSLFGLPYTALKRIEKGTFLFQNEYEVTFDRDFYAGAYPVTQELYEKVMDINPSRFKGKQRPVEKISRDDVQAFLKKLNELTKDTYNDELEFRLPTDAMWEYCARNAAWEVEGKVDIQRHKLGDFSGSHILDEVGWYDTNSHQQTQPVGLKEPNLRGLYDMSGNVFEWCEDGYDDTIRPGYTNGFEVNKVTKKEISRVVRGGCWLDSGGGSRLLDRDGAGPGDQYDELGFRLFRY